MIYLFLIVFILMTLAALYAQHKHYDFIQSQNKNKSMTEVNELVQIKFKEFDDYKKKVDSLVIRVGFKL